jgi:signal transduction histidine kinase/ActR/RegA family two-component response regulator/sensor domain CHASE-containing protein
MRIGRRGGLRLPPPPGGRYRLALTAVLLAATALAAWQVDSVIAARDRSRFDSEVRRIDTAIEERMRAYVQVLRGTVGLFDASDEVTRTDWRRYVAALRLSEDYPGFKQAGFAPEVPRAELAAFVRRVRAEPLPAGLDDPAVLRRYRVRSPAAALGLDKSRGLPALASPVLYLEPFTKINQRVLGVDMLREPLRREALLRARATGGAVLSPRLRLTAGKGAESGFIVYLGVRKGGRPIGWVTAVLQTERFMRGLLGKAGTSLSFEVSDRTRRGTEALLWSSAGTAADLGPKPLPAEPGSAFERTTLVQMPGRKWAVRYVAGPSYGSTMGRLSPWPVALAGLLLTGLIVLGARGAARWRQQAALLESQAVTLRDARDVAEAATRAKAAFLATMSHEIRTPMNAVIGMSSMLLRAPLRREQRERAEVIRSSGEHLLHVINEILDFSKLESGRVELEHAPFDLAACLESAVDLVRAGADARDVQVRIELEPGVPQWVSGDVSRLRQILLNLLSNAVRHAREHVTLTCAASTHADGWELAIRVADDGPGIDSAEQQRLFEAFTQGRKAKPGGTGLGLSIAKRLVEAMGGAIGVSSTPGDGATFHFTALVGVAVAEARPDAPAEPPAGVDAIRVLVAEDHPINQLMARDAFSALGCVPDVVADGVEVLAAFERQSYDIVFLDLHMPVLDGLATARELRRRLGDECPWLVAMTADVLEEARAEARLAGMDDFVAKPATSEDLARALRRCARRERAEPLADPIV